MTDTPQRCPDCGHTLAYLAERGTTRLYCLTCEEQGGPEPLVPNKRERELSEEWTSDVGYQRPYADSLARYREEMLRQIAEALKPGYSAFPASDAEILKHAREVVAKLRGGET